MSLLGHVHQLSEVISPRGSATEGKAKASDYVQHRLSELGLSPQRQPVISATSAYAPFIVATGATLLGVFLFWQPQPVGAAAALVLALTAFVFALLELALIENPLRWVIPIGWSQNVLTVVPAVTQHGKRSSVLITAHLDAHRTPVLFSSPGWRRAFRVLMPARLGCIAVLAVLFAVGILFEAHVLRQLALVPGVVVVVTFLLMIQAATSPFNRGANDNASGVAVALSLAERLVWQPLQHRDAIVVFTACEAFIHAHRQDLKGAIHLVIDHVGGLKRRDFRPSVVRRERFMRRIACDPHLVQIAQRIAYEHPELCAAVRDFDLAYSELSIGAKHGLRTLGLIGLTPEGDLPNWHASDDVISNLNEATLERTVEFAWRWLQAIDAEDGT